MFQFFLAILVLAAIFLAGETAGAATAEVPFCQQQTTKQIKTLQDLRDVAKNLSGNYCLANDIDASATSTSITVFTPIGDSKNPFVGTFDGNGHVIDQLSIGWVASSSGSGGWGGFFGLVGMSGTVRNVGITNGLFDVGTTLSSGTMGLLAAQNSGDVANCFASGAMVVSASTSNVGGLIGANQGHVSNSHAAVHILGADPSGYTGGFVGFNTDSGVITQSYASGDISTPGNAVYKGGFAGINRGVIRRSFATGNVLDVSAVNDGTISIVGGFVGSHGPGSISESYATGSVTSLGGYAGGFAGGASGGGIIWQSYSVGPVSGGSQQGGFVGSSSAIFVDDYWDKSASGQPSDGDRTGGTKGLTTAELKAGLPPGFDPTIWGIVPTVTYPYLLWQKPAAPPVAVNETAATNANTSVTIDLSAGATGNPTSAALVGTPVGGTVAGFPAMKVTFTPAKGFTGAAIFQFTLANAVGTSNTATASITVKGVAPTAVHETATTVANVPVSIDLSKGATGNPTSAALVGTPVGGAVTGFPATKVTFTPAKGFTGAASFQFTLANAFGKSNTATTAVTVTGADPNFKVTASAYCNTSPPVGPAVKLNWTAPKGAASYDLYRNGTLYSQNIRQTSFDNNANVTASDTYTYFVVAHASSGDVESNPASVSVPIATCSPAMLPDLVAQNLSLSATTVEAGSNLVVRFTIHNTKGGASAGPSVTHIRLGKSNNNVTVNDPLLLSLSTPAIAPEGDKNKGDSYEVIQQVPIPNNQAAGSYYLWVILDSTSSAGQGKANELNDEIVLPIAVTNSVAGPDLVVRDLNVAPQKLAPGASTTVSFSIANQGSKSASASTTKIFLSASNSNISSTDPLLGSLPTLSIAPGHALPFSVSVPVPGSKPVGDYFLWVVPDANNTAGQSAAAKANDRSFGSIIVAADRQPVPVRLIRALGGTINTVLASQNLPDLLDKIKSQVGIWKDVRDDFNLIRSNGDLSASLEYWRGISPSLERQIDAVQQDLERSVAGKIGFQVAAEEAKHILDSSVDEVVGNWLQRKQSLPLAHSIADTVFHIGLAYFTGDGFEAFNALWDQAILIWKENAALDKDMCDYVHMLRVCPMTS